MFPCPVRAVREGGGICSGLVLLWDWRELKPHSRFATIEVTLHHYHTLQTCDTFHPVFSTRYRCQSHHLKETASMLLVVLRRSTFLLRFPRERKRSPVDQSQWGSKRPVDHEAISDINHVKHVYPATSYCDCRCCNALIGRMHWYLGRAWSMSMSCIFRWVVASVCGTHAWASTFEVQTWCHEQDDILFVCHNVWVCTCLLCVSSAKMRLYGSCCNRRPRRI